MRKVIISLISIIIFCSYPHIYANPPSNTTIKIYNNDQLLDISSNAIIKENQVLVPFRQFFEIFGANVFWNASKKTATATKDNFSITVEQSSFRSWINKEEHKMTQAPIIFNQSLYISLRYASEALGLSIQYDKNPISVFLYQLDNDFKRIIESISDHRNEIEQKHSIKILYISVLNNRLWIEIRSYGDIERVFTQEEIQAISDTIYKILGKTIDFELSIQECCTRDADFTGIVTEIDIEKNGF
ncbi:copper amine oxidase N-terminal domain-containing protein [Cohnella cholangitidis]|nr:copper amine oxidase N-terminal domain-containing protein [Cohnella cholangitidis]